jgi:hypothetical protein
VRRLRIVPEAEEELGEAAAWYEAKRPGLGIELVAIADRAFEEIADAPFVYGLWRDDRPYRRKVLTRFPYVIFVRVDPRRDRRPRRCAREASAGILGRASAARALTA